MTTEQRWTDRQVRAAAHLLDAARHGQCIVYLASSQVDARAVFELIAAYERRSPAGGIIRRTNGAECYVHPPSAGSIDFRNSSRSSLGGVAADQVLVDDINDIAEGRPAFKWLQPLGATVWLVDNL